MSGRGRSRLRRDGANTASEEDPLLHGETHGPIIDDQARAHTMPQERRQELDAHGTRPDLIAQACCAVHGDAFVADLHRFRNRARVQ
jgi:hypothetical protein